MPNPAIDQLLRALFDRRGSDLHLSTGMPPLMRKDGDILQIVRTWTFTNDALKTRSVAK